MQKMLLIFIILLSQVAFSKGADSYVEKLRDKTFSEDFGTLWHEAFFIPIRTGHKNLSKIKRALPTIDLNCLSLSKLAS